MATKKNHHLVSIRIEEVLAKIVNHEFVAAPEPPKLNLGSAPHSFLVCLESFFHFNFELNRALRELMESRQVKGESAQNQDRVARVTTQENVADDASTITSSCRKPGSSCPLGNEDFAEERALDLYQQHWAVSGEQSVAQAFDSTMTGGLSINRFPRRAK